MKIDTVEEISRWLDQSGRLGEALLTDLRLVNHGYSVRIEFSIIIDAEGRVLDDPLGVQFELDAVQRLAFQGGLNAAMIEHPDKINWSLSEVALVRVTSTNEGLRFEARWEGGERRIEIECRRATLTVPHERTHFYPRQPGG